MRLIESEILNVELEDEAQWDDIPMKDNICNDGSEEWEVIEDEEVILNEWAMVETSEAMPAKY